MLLLTLALLIIQAMINFWYYFWSPMNYIFAQSDNTARQSIFKKCHTILPLHTMLNWSFSTWSMTDIWYAMTFMFQSSFSHVYLNFNILRRTFISKERDKVYFGIKEDESIALLSEQTFICLNIRWICRMRLRELV